MANFLKNRILNFLSLKKRIALTKSFNIIFGTFVYMHDWSLSGTATSLKVG